MSKIGNVPVQIPSTVQIKLVSNSIEVTGKEGKQTIEFPAVLDVKHDGDKIVIKPKNNLKTTRSVHGLYRQLISNAIKGVEVPWTKKLEVVGTGFNVKLQGEDIVFKIGFSHPVIFKKQENIKYQVEGNNKVVVSGIDKQMVGQVAYQMKIIKPPDSYKGKGIRYLGEVIKLKPGKKVKAAGAAA